MESLVESTHKSVSLSEGESDIDISSFIVPQVILKEESLSSESSDHFFEEDLVWPDPENVFPKTSGIKPSVLTAELKHLNVGGMDLQPKTRCQLAQMVRKRPRPKSLPWNVVIIDSDPPIIEEQDVEEYLVHDPLFVEFFNAFLALPSFPEPICFNVESGGFEVVTDGKLKLAQQIKEAVRSQKSKNDMYERTHQHAFSDIPVVPIEDTQGPVQVQIERTFDVTAINKEQGIKWVKAARLPIFLESDYYFQYRLAKVISQASIFNEDGEFVVMKIDYTTKSKTRKMEVEVQPPTQEELIMKQMFVSFGDLKGAAKEAWFNQAKKQLKAEPTFSSLGSKLTPAAAGDANYLVKPSKKSSVFNSQYFGVYLPGLLGPKDTEPPIHDKVKFEEHMISRERPFTPRPSDKIHAATSMLRAKLSKDPNADEEMVPAGHVVFIWPKQDLQSTSTESNLVDKADREAAFANRMKEHQIIDQIYNDGSWEEGGTGNIVLKSVDELGSVIVGAVMKKTIADLLKKTEEDVIADPAISSIYPNKDLTCVSVDKLNLCVVVETQESIADMPHSSPSCAEVISDIENIPDREPVHVKWKHPVRKPAEEDPQEESLLDSDEDFEDRDIHFRRNKEKWHSLTSVKGIQAFKKFLRGTQGEKYWELWLDIDKGRLIRNEEEKQKYIMHMRDKYYKKGSQFELSAENKRKLKLENLSQWIPEYLLKVQAKVLEPLVLYWAPRYLLRHLIHTNPEKFYLYNELKLSMQNPSSDPYPNTQELLPLRPKSCCPRSTSGYGVWEMNYNTFKTSVQDLGTSPKVGNRRVYGNDTIQRLANTPTAKYLNISKYTKRAAKTTEVQEPTHYSVINFKSSHLSRKISERSSETVTGEEIADPSSHFELKSFAEGVLPSRESISQSVTVDVSKLEKPAEGVKIPCPYKAIGSILFGSREGAHSIASQAHSGTSRTHSAMAPDKKPKELLFPPVKTGSIKGEKCKGVKSTPFRKIESQETTNYTFFRQESKESRKICEQFQSAFMEGLMSSQEAQMIEDQECDFLGSKHIDFLLQVLHHEQDSGRAFRKFIENKKREDWLNNLDFWEKVQEYRKLFYKDKLDLHFITKHARTIFAQCIVESAPQSINISEHIKLYILDHLNPPYEDLYDRAEENALKILFEAFRLYMSEEIRNYCEVERSVVQQRLETRNSYILDLQKQGIIKERLLTPDDPMEGFVDPVYDDSILAKIPERFAQWNMDTLAQNKLELEYFRQFLISRCAEMDIKCWMDIEAWRQTAPQDKALRDQRAKDIKKNYLNKKYFFGPNGPAGKDGQNKVMEAGGGWGKFLEDKPHFSSILKAQKYVRARLEKKHLPYYLISYDFQERHLADTSMTGDLDAFAFHKKRSVAMMRVINEAEEAFGHITDQKEKLFTDIDIWTASMSETTHVSEKFTESVPSVIPAKSDRSVVQESRWTAAAREIFFLQKALKNPTSCAQFKKFVSLSGGYLENDIMFWLEVQKYKKMYHDHVEDALLQGKSNAIINCFINSYLPPDLQIDISQEMADNIMEHKHELSPYIFRQAEVTVFRGLLPHWVAFRQYHKRLGTEDKILQTLDRHRALAFTREQKFKERLAQQREMERLYRLQHPTKSDEMQVGEEGKETLSFSYSDYLAQQAAMTDEQLRASLFSKGTQTIRSRGNSAVAMSRSDLDITEIGDEQLDIMIDEFGLGSRRTSEQIGKKRPSDVSSATSRQAKGEVRGGPRKVKKSQAVRPASVKQ